jgi:hypothetical protein
MQNVDKRQLNTVVGRLRRALAHTGEDILISQVVEGAANIILEDMPPEAAGLLESILDTFARAAEELGPDATVEEIADLARKIERRPN